MNSPLPHDSWAEHYEAVMVSTYGHTYARLTSTACDEVASRVEPGASIVDFGAGCGRLAVPLVRDGYRVTAVEPSPGMIDQLRAARRRLAATDPTAAARLTVVQAPMQAVDGSGIHDMALCVFTVIAYLLDEDALTSAFHAVHASLRPGGFFLVDVPDEEVFDSFDVESAEIIREVAIEACGNHLYDYRESTLLRTSNGTERFEDRFTLRHWTVAEVTHTLETVGFSPHDDVRDRFTELGARYLLVRRDN